MVQLLTTAAIISFLISLLSHYQSNNDDDLPIWIEPAVIFIIIIANGVIGIYQDYNADSSVETLKKMQSLSNSVLRNSLWQRIESKFLTVGDIVSLKTGDVVPADLKILKLLSLSFHVNQSMLNGESEQVEKTEIPL